MSRHTPTFKLHSAALFEDQEESWRGSTFNCPVPSMMVQDELLFLHYLVSNHYRAIGAIVDFGPLAGASTYSMASGLRDAGHIFSYDVWHFHPDWEVFFPGNSLRQGDDLLPLFLEYVAPFRQKITAFKGDLTSQSWDRGPIEIAFIDAAKSPRAMWHIVNEFLPNLVPGGYVIHQDFVSAECPWIHMAVSFIADYFEYCESPSGGTVCARLKRKLPPGLLAPGYFDSNSGATAHTLLADARDILVGWWGLCVWLSEANYWIYKGDLDQAGQILEKVRAHPSFGIGVHPDMDLVRSALENERAGKRRLEP